MERFPLGFLASLDLCEMIRDDWLNSVGAATENCVEDDLILAIPGCVDRVWWCGLFFSDCFGWYATAIDEVFEVKSD